MPVCLYIRLSLMWWHKMYMQLIIRQWICFICNITQVPLTMYHSSEYDRNMMREYRNFDLERCQGALDRKALTSSQPWLPWWAIHHSANLFVSGECIHWIESELAGDQLNGNKTELRNEILLHLEDDWRSRRLDTCFRDGNHGIRIIICLYVNPKKKKTLFLKYQ